MGYIHKNCYMSYYDTKRSNKEIVKKKKSVCVCNIYEVYEKYMYREIYYAYIFYERINLRYADLEKYSCTRMFLFFFNFFTNPLSHIDKFSPYIRYHYVYQFGELQYATPCSSKNFAIAIVL